MREGEKRGAVGKESINPYFENQKYPEPTLCPRCGLVYRHGRWQAVAEPLTDPFHESHCPACRREIDRYPAGLVLLRGGYLTKHHQEILNIARNQAASAAAARPLQRIMWIEEEEDRMEIATTNGHLAQRIGKAIGSACKGDLTIKHAAGDQLVRVYWSREG
jgi:NMD protein affecting ribosome stability and mRNA decay